MKYTFSKNELHTVTEANINYYAIPFVHPRRIMQEHDFMGMMDEAIQAAYDRNQVLATELDKAA